MKELNEHEKAKRRAKRAIENHPRGDKWMQKWIDWEDKDIPIGRRRVAYVRYQTMVHKMPLEKAKYYASKYIH